jgi:hypothetical protein
MNWKKLTELTSNLTGVSRREPNPPCLSDNRAVIQSLSTIVEHLPIKQTRSPTSIVKSFSTSNLNLEAVWNFGWGVLGRGRGGVCRDDLFRFFEPQFGHSATTADESVPPTIPHSEQSKMGC